MLISDIFNDRMFEAVELKKIIDNLDHIPSTVRDLDLFESEPIRTDHVALMRTKDDFLALVPTSERGGPFPQMRRPVREARNLYSRRVGKEDVIKSSELLNVLSDALPTEVAVERGLEEVTKRFQRMQRDLDLTLEKYEFDVVTSGLWRDADGSTMEDFYAQFGFVAPGNISIDLTPATNLNLREWIFTNIALPMKAALKARMTPATRIHALCGDSFWSKFVTHPRVEKTYEGYAAAAELRGEVAVEGVFPFGGVVWHHYYGTHDGTTVDVATNQAKFFPKGAIDVFKRYLAPGENMEDLGELGEEWYPIVQPDPETKKNRFVEISNAQYPIYACLAPNALLKAQHT